MEIKNSLHFPRLSPNASPLRPHAPLANYSSAPPARGTPRSRTLRPHAPLATQNPSSEPSPPARQKSHHYPVATVGRGHTPALHDRLGEIPIPNSFCFAASRLIPVRSSRRAPRRRAHAPSSCRAYGSARSCRHPASWPKCPPVSSPPRRRFLHPRRGRSGWSRDPSRSGG
jgi:hypothetical protein